MTSLAEPQETGINPHLDGASAAAVNAGC